MIEAAPYQRKYVYGMTDLNELVLYLQANTHKVWCYLSFGGTRGSGFSLWCDWQQKKANNQVEELKAKELKESSWEIWIDRELLTHWLRLILRGKTQLKACTLNKSFLVISWFYCQMTTIISLYWKRKRQRLNDTRCLLF